jgi:aspartyl-tRNA(Asn)/glutamyl-tRNA(Gln) amidotransferase subunit A
VVSRALERIQAGNGAINALTQVFADAAHDRAAHLDALIAQGEDPGPLAGVPVAIKENICTTLGFTTCASRMLERYRSPFDATVVTRLIAAGAVPIAKANCDEFAMGSSTENSIFGPARNPRDHARVAGGSSGGSAAAVAGGLVPIALGTDTGGSIRQPASHCGCVGLKPTYGRVSRYGLVAYASSLDQCGPLATSVRDAALVLSVLAGPDEHDATCDQGTPPDLLSQLEEPPHRLTLGVPRELLDLARGTSAAPSSGTTGGNSPGVAAAVALAVDRLGAAGARIVPIDLPSSGHAIAAYYLVATAEASSNLARFDGVRFGRRADLGPGASLADLYRRSRSEGFSPEVQRRIMLGTYALSSGYYDAYYLRAMKVRRLVKRDFDAAFAQGCTAVLMPCAPGPAFRLGEKVSDPLAMYLEDVYTVGVNLAGLPAISVPFAHENGRDGTGLPIGLQLIGPAMGEPTLLRAARVLERLAVPGAA